MERKVYVLQWARKKEKKKYHETVVQMMQRGRFLLGAANFTRACASLQCARIPDILTIKPRHDYNGILPQKWELPFTFGILHLILIHLCDFVSGEEVWRGGGWEEEDAVLYSAAPPARAIRPYGAGPSSLLIIDWGKEAGTSLPSGLLFCNLGGLAWQHHLPIPSHSQVIRQNLNRQKSERTTSKRARW